MTFETQACRESVYTNYRLQLPEREVLGTIVVRNGRIVEIDDTLSHVGEDGHGAILMPGFVELRTEALAAALHPRPGVRWPRASATIYHDRAMASAGITTACDAITVGDADTEEGRGDAYLGTIKELTDGVVAGRFSVDHRLHLRCELADDGLVHDVDRLIDHPLLAIISVVDRADRDPEHRDRARPNRRAIAEMARAHDIAFATLDDATIEHVREAMADGATVAEFPTTLEAARSAHMAGIAVMIDSPNLVLGNTHAGSVAARELAREGFVDAVSSEYLPASLLEAVFAFARESGKPLFNAMRAATITPARAIGLDDDRGSLAIGKRADLIFVDVRQALPRITGVVALGFRVA